MPNIPVPPQATTAGIAPHGQTTTVNPQAKQPTANVWGSKLLANPMPNQAAPKQAPGVAHFGQMFGISSPKQAAAVTRRPWTINGADALMSAQYYSRKRKDGSQQRAVVTMPATTDAPATKQADLSPFARGFLDYCLSKGLPGSVVKAAAARVGEILPSKRAELEPLVKSAGPLDWIPKALGAAKGLFRPTAAQGVKAWNAVSAPASKAYNAAAAPLGKAWNYTPKGSRLPLAPRLLDAATNTLAGLTMGDMADNMIGVTGYDTDLGKWLGGGLGLLGGSRRLRHLTRGASPALGHALVSKQGPVQRGIASLGKPLAVWGGVDAASNFGKGRLIDQGLDQAAQQMGFPDRGAMINFAQMYNQGDLTGLAKHFWGNMSPEAKSALIGGGLMLGGGLLNSVTGSSMPGYAGLAAGGSMMLPAAAKMFMGGGTPVANTPAAAPTYDQQAAASGEQTAPAALTQLARRDEYNRQVGQQGAYA